ncbi:thiamine phosphate synthase [Myxococcus llanfairpwllgwyngyllgogerychwyrndrobwllllantysiliogogogochensis]|uniref:Thiamine-phosphate synthase n=1 Tax=Myxococcus llanfairpwllgwyngyllgogerychwyrndrobwllllantysiliogogogochensis TaxID=2590453 RepID=A0A540WKU4_9BACT|nr:thiamine phosphate synthase [Myxococcus llanfairpwllgwyngyllgogerychwyrndrobwllllantysiliogogogochensis]TQF09660.1 thiamine phosphate synthase [Myxococcus llanfairpwllgwyngyllgogerychwyrndrobwllllantysiliogogogochensis]
MNAPPRPLLPPGLYLLCDDTVRVDMPLVLKAERMLAGGARVVQLRMKRTPVREALSVAREVVRLCRRAGAVCLLNDRVDLALLADADGVHVGDEDLPAEAARALLGPGRLVGVTVRDAEGARAAREAGADYVGVGPVFGTTTKQVPAPVLGLEGLARVVTDSPLPVVGIGGVGLENVGRVAASGAHGAAVVSDVLLAQDLAERVRLLTAAFERGRVGG